MLSFIGNLSTCGLSFTHKDFVPTDGGVHCKFEWRRSNLKQSELCKLIAPTKYSHTAESGSFYMLPIILTTGNPELNVAQSVLALPNAYATGMRHFHYNSFYDCPLKDVRDTKDPHTANHGGSKLLEYTYSHAVCNVIKPPWGLHAVAFNKSTLTDAGYSKSSVVTTYHLVVN